MRRTALLFRGLWRFHRGAVLIAGALFAGTLLAGGLLASATVSGGSEGPADGEADRLLLDRVWIDRLPEEGTDPVHVEVWLSGGVVVFQHGTSFRYLTEVAEFERSGNRIRGELLQDGESFAARFRVSRCDDLPPFDLCLQKRGAPRGPALLHGFSDSAAEAEHLPATPRLALPR